MTDCNATLNGMKCGKYGHPDGTLHRHKHEPAADRGCYAAWTDGFPGAKPHVEPEPTVTYEEVEVAKVAFCLEGTWQEGVRAALAAAFAIRDKEQNR